MKRRVCFVIWFVGWGIMFSSLVFRFFVLLGFLCSSFLAFSDEDRIDLKPLKKYDNVPDRSRPKTPQLLDSKQKDAKVFLFETIVFQDCTVLSDKTQRRLVKPYLNKKLSLNDLNGLIAAVHQAYNTAGYVLDGVYFKKESFKKPRHLVIFLVELKLNGLRLSEKKKHGRRINSLINVNANRVLKITDLQSAFDILNELETTSYDFKINTNPERTLHVADIALNKHKKMGFGLGYDNQGDRDTGRDRYTLETRFEDVLGLFDQWRFIHTTTRNPFSKVRYSQTSMISLSVPYRRWRVSFYGVFSKDKHPLEGISLKTDQVQWGTDLRYTLSRTWDSGTYIGTTLEHYSKLAYFNDYWLQTQSGDVTKWVLWASHYHYILGGHVYGKLSYSQGIHASDAGIGSLFDKNFKKLNADIFFQRGFGKRLRWMLSGEAQIGEPDLYNHEKFSLGGISTVRGFLGSQYKSDSGYFIRNELEYLLFNRYATRFFVGYDYGHLKPSLTDSIEEKTLQSICCGVRLNVKRINFEMLMARPIRTIKSNCYTFLLGIRGDF